MKIKHILLASVLLTGMLTGCNNNFLEEIPRDELSDASFWKSQDDVKNSRLLYTDIPWNRGIS